MKTFTPSEFLERFPKAKLNVANEQINSVLQSFIVKYNHRFDKSWQTVGILLKEHFSTNGIVFPSCNDRKPEFWTVRGWDNPTQKINESKNYFPTSVKYWVKKGFSEKEAKEKAGNFYRDKLKGKRLLPTQLEYYLKQGMSKKEAEKALKAEQTKRVGNLINKETANPELRKRRLWNQIEYWLNKGYSEEAGYQMMAEKFQERNLQTMKKLTQKYIDKGLNESDALAQAQSDYQKRAKQTMKTRIKNKSFGFQKASKQSLDFFKPLMDHLDKTNTKYYVGVEGSAEWFLAKGADYFYSFDFYIPSKKLLIEYNGEHVHPNPKMSTEEWNAWQHCWTKKTATECRDLDLVKINVAKELGYEVVEVFESDMIKSTELV